MQIRLEPSINQWPKPTADRPIWTGHQLSLFHPGIVTKYFAAHAVSSDSGVAYHNIVVDQDVYDPLTITLPRRDGDRLSIRQFSLGRVAADVPVGMQPPLGVTDVQRRLGELPADAGVDGDRLAAAFSQTQTPPSLAVQMDAVLRRLLPSYAAAAPSAFASRLLADEANVIGSMLHDAPRCAELYNDAVRQFPGAGMSRMVIEPIRVEVPLWVLRWMKPRQRVYVDIADSVPIFVTGDGEPVVPSHEVTLAPRALLMTAMLRRPGRASLFIHGTGGWNYDRITEHWWQNWQGQTLAPMALATADVFLDFEHVPVNPPEVLRQAVWRAHHLPHNLDRALKLPGAGDGRLVAEKRQLLKHMDDDRDKKRRRAAFERVHAINAALAAQHPGAIAAAKHGVEQARIGVTNRTIAGKRDWSFLLYPDAKLETLRAMIQSHV